MCTISRESVFQISKSWELSLLTFTSLGFHEMGVGGSPVFFPWSLIRRLVGGVGPHCFVLFFLSAPTGLDKPCLGQAG